MHFSKCGSDNEQIETFEVTEFMYTHREIN